MKLAFTRRSVLIRYVLGKLSSKRRTLKLAKRYFADDEVFDELLAVENDLLHQYVQGHLASDEHKRFGRYLAKLSDGQHRITTATALIKVVAEEKQAAATLLARERPVPTFSWQSLLPLVPDAERAARYLLVTILLMMSMGAGILLVLNYQLRSINEQLQTQLRQSETEKAGLQQKTQVLQQQINANSARQSQVPEELKAEQGRGNEQAQKLSKPEAPLPFTASLVLTPAARGLARPDTLLLRQATKSVLITIPIEGDNKSKQHRAVLQTTDGQVWPQNKLELQSAATGKALVLTLDARHFTSTTYKLTLIEVANDGTEFAQDYYFNIIER